MGTYTINLLISINIATLVTFLTMAWKVSKFFNRIEFKVDELWGDYKERQSLGHYRRASDPRSEADDIR